MLAAFVLLIGAANAATWNVPGDFSSIQAAIDDISVGDGDEIIIGSGTYNESLTLTKRLNLIGNGASPGDVIIVNDSGPNLTLAASGLPGTPLLIQNLMLQTDTTQGIVVQSGLSLSDIKLDLVWVVGTDPTDDTENERGLWVPMLSSLTDFEVVDCRFTNLCYGWYIGLNPTGSDWSGVGTMFDQVTVTRTVFATNSAKGLYIEKMSNTDFVDCDVTDNGSDIGFWNSNWNAGLDLNLKGQAYANIVFDGCRITGNGLGAGEGAGLLLKARDDGTSYSTHPASLANVDVLNCVISGNERGLRLGEPNKLNLTPTGVVVSGCSLLGNEPAFVGSASETGDLVMMSVPDCTATGNYWGSLDPTAQIGIGAGAGAVSWDPVLTSNPLAEILNVGDYASIQAAINAAASGDIVFIPNGTYFESLNISKNLVLRGESETGVVIDASGNDDYSIDCSGDLLTTFEDFSLIGHTTGDAAYGLKIAGDDAATIVRRVTISGSRRSALDLNGLVAATITDVDCSGVAYGVGIGLTDCSNVELSDLTTAGNAWGGLGIFTMGSAFTLGSDNITLSGTNSFGEGTIYTEIGNADDPANPAPITNLTITTGDCPYIYLNSNLPNHTMYAVSLAEAEAKAALAPETTSIIDRSTGRFHVAPGMMIQPAIDAAADNDVIDILDGLYVEQLVIAKPVTLQGQGEGTVVQAPAVMVVQHTTSYGHRPIVFVTTTDGVLLQDLKVDGAGMGNTNAKMFGVEMIDAGATLNRVTVADVRNDPLNGAQQGNGVYTYNTDTVAHTVAVTDCSIVGFQKNGVTFNAGDDTPLTAICTGTSIIGHGATTITAQNGVQTWGALVDLTLADTVIEGIGYIGDTWAGMAVLGYSCNSMVATTNTMTDVQVGLYCVAGDFTATGNNIGVQQSVGQVETWGIYANNYYTTKGAARPSPVAEDKLAGNLDKATRLASIQNNEVFFTGTDNTSWYGIVFYPETDSMAVTANGNLVVGFESGFVAYDGTYTVLDLAGNSLGGNTYAYLAGTTVPLADLSGCWLGGPDPVVVAGMVAQPADYTPWYAVGTDTEPGTVGWQGDPGELWIDDDSPQNGGDGRVVEAVALIGDPGILHVVGGDYAGSGQTVVSGDLSVLGDPADPAILRPGFSTGGAGDARGWWLVTTTGNLSMHDLVLDGVGHDVYQGIRAHGAGELVDCQLRNIIYPNYAGVALAAFGDFNWTVRGCTFADIGRIGILLFGTGITDGLVEYCTYTGKGAVDRLDYFVEFGGGATGTVQHCVATDCLGVATSDGSTSGAVMATTFFGDGTTATVLNNVFNNNTTGVIVGYDDTDQSTVVANNNDLSGNEWGINNAGLMQVDGRWNWWGDATGPEHPTLNPGGLGSKVSDYVTFDPYRTGAVICTPDIVNLNEATPTNSTVVSYLGGFGPVYGYSITVTWDQALATGAIAQPADGPFATPPVWQVIPLPNGFTIDTAIGGDVPGVAMADLFQIELTAVDGAFGETPLDITVNYIQDSGGVPPVEDVPADDGLIRVDLGLPVVTNPVITNTTLGSTLWVKNGDDVVVTATITDVGGLSSVIADLTGLGGTLDATPDGPPVGDVYTWTFTPVSGSGDGLVTVTITATDDVGNIGIGQATITADNTAPQALTTVAALPGHEKIHLSWDDLAGLDDNVAGVEFRYVAQGVYPTYLNAMPPAPADHLAGDFAIQATGTTVDWAIEARDIYVLAAFVYDFAGNYGAADPADGNWDLATNYFLGDVHPPANGDGYVTPLDVHWLGESYGVSTGHGSFNANCDVGPTNDWSRFGYPMPDGDVGFYDLMIFSMNFGEVSPSTKADIIVDEPQLAWTRVDADTWALELLNPSSGLKGLNLKADLPSGVSCTVRPGDLLGDQEADTFLRNIDSHGLDAGMAILGFGEDVQGRGQLIVVKTSQPVEHLEVEVEARDINNQEILVEMQHTTGVDIPTVFSMNQNYPNPFNPMTTVKYSLPQDADVRLVVYGIDGRLVHVLVDERREAGHHEVVWQGRDGAGRRVATGTYFCVIDAGDFHQVRKMSLVK